jgi:hypothetical protein
MSEESPANGLIEMVVDSVRVHMLSSQHVVILKELDRERYLPIWIGPWEANAIAMRLQGLEPERPLTHDVFASTLDRLGVEIRRVVIAELAQETYLARLYLVSAGREIEIDSRPSDALALAVRSGGRIFAAAAVLARAGVEPEAGTSGGLESTGGVVHDERLEVFRDFVNSLDVDPEEEHREGPGPDVV